MQDSGSACISAAATDIEVLVIQRPVDQEIGCGMVVVNRGGGTGRKSTNLRTCEACRRIPGKINTATPHASSATVGVMVGWLDQADVIFGVSNLSRCAGCLVVGKSDRAFRGSADILSAGKRHHDFCHQGNLAGGAGDVARQQIAIKLGACGSNFRDRRVRNAGLGRRNAAFLNNVAAVVAENQKSKACA